MMNGIDTREREVLQKARWDMLRSDIYIRDKGICWVCGKIVDLRNYDLGHLVDRCNGGQDDYDNLAVMHKHCNITKPRHTSLEETMKWELTAQYLTVRPMAKRSPPKEQLSFIANVQTITPPVTVTQQSTNKTPVRIPDLSKMMYPPEKLPKYIMATDTSGGTTVYTKQKQPTESDTSAAKQLVIEYFTNRPELLTKEQVKNRNHAIQQIAATLEIDTKIIRFFLLEANLIKSQNPITPNDNLYYYINDHLEELVNKFNNLNVCLWDKPKALGLTTYGMNIMLYLSGSYINEKDKRSIAKRVTELNLPIRHLQINHKPRSLNKR